jgi:putative ABC transport system permease protein
VLVASQLTHLPRVHEIAVDPLVLAFTLAVALGSGLLFGLIPVFKYARPQVATGLRGAAGR